MDRKRSVHRDYANVLGERMHYLAAGQVSGARTALLFLHGNPTSAELWRDVIEQLSGIPCIAVDLIGMGRSSKPDIAYRFADHARFLDGFIAAMGLERFVIVGHDWGVALGADLIAQHPEGALGFAFLEGRLEPLADWSAFDEGGRQLFRSFRTEEGARAVLEENFLVETILQAGTVRSLTGNELTLYRSFYPDPRARRPLLQWTREIPVAGEPADTAKRMRANCEALRTSLIAKLAMWAQPGAVVTSVDLARWQDDLPNLTVVDVGEGTHFVPHDRAYAIADALRSWLALIDKCAGA